MRFSRKLYLICTVLIVIAGILFPRSARCITVKEEEKLSREFMKVVLKKFTLIKAPAIVNYVNAVGQKIVSVYPPQLFKYHFYVIKEDSYNAFASPAGHIFINSGLLAAMESEEELAGVISHEIAHVSLRHISKKIERSKKIGFATLAGMVAGVLLGASGASDAAGAVVAGSAAAGQTAMLAYSRDDEAEADQIGFEYLNRAGYSAKGLLLVQKKMRDQQWFGSNQIPTYLQTHPSSENRMASIDIWLAKHEKVHTNIDPYPFKRTHTWLVAGYGDEKAALKRFKSKVENHPENSLAHYGYGLILARTGNYTDAVGHLKTALEKNAFEQYFIRDLGRVYFLAGRYEKALKVLQSFKIMAPNHPLRLFYLGRTQIKMGLYQDAIDAFEKLISLYPDYTEAYYFIGYTYGKLDKLNYAHYYLGVYYKMISNHKTASFHLKKALKTMGDPEKRVKIEVMLVEIHKKRHK